jgi:formylglycine-generating enzyme required for sulfatase activity
VHDRYYWSSTYANPTGPAAGSNRVVRGGGWHYGASYLRSAGRYLSIGDPTFRYYDTGFRVLAVRH